MSGHIDKIVYINLDKRTDRRGEIEGELNRYGLEYERFTAIEHQEGIVGCGYSHLRVLEMAKQRGLKNVLIFEDDFTFLVNKIEFENQLRLFFETFGDDYNVYMLAYNLCQSGPLEGIESRCCLDLTQLASLVGRVIEAQTASGYLVNANYFDTLIDLYRKNIPLLEQTGKHWIYANDQIWKPLQKRDKWYYPTTRIGMQRDGYSDNAKCYVSYNC